MNSLTNSFSITLIAAAISACSPTEDKECVRDFKSELNTAENTYLSYKERSDSLRKVFEATKRECPGISDSEIKRLINLLDDKDDGIVYWSANTLGIIGGRANAAIPKLNVVFNRTKCVSGGQTTASGARFALERLGQNPDSMGDCSGSRQER